MTDPARTLHQHEAEVLGEHPELSETMRQLLAALKTWRASRAALLEGLHFGSIDAKSPESGATGPEIVEAASKVYETAGQHFLIILERLNRLRATGSPIPRDTPTDRTTPSTTTEEDHQ